MYELYDDVESGFVRMKRGKDYDFGGPVESLAKQYLAIATKPGSRYLESSFKESNRGSIESECKQWTYEHTIKIGNKDYHKECAGLIFADDSALLYADPDATVYRETEWSGNYAETTTHYTCECPRVDGPIQPVEVIHTHPDGNSNLSDEDKQWQREERKRQNNKNFKLRAIGYKLD